jgi:hypothetical protein
MAAGAASTLCQAACGSLALWQRTDQPTSGPRRRSHTPRAVYWHDYGNSNYSRAAAHLARLQVRAASEAAQPEGGGAGCPGAEGSPGGNSGGHLRGAPPGGAQRAAGMRLAAPAAPPPLGRMRARCGTWAPPTWTSRACKRCWTPGSRSLTTKSRRVPVALSTLNPTAHPPLQPPLRASQRAARLVHSKPCALWRRRTDAPQWRRGCSSPVHP